MVNNRVANVSFFEKFCQKFKQFIWSGSFHLTEQWSCSLWSWLCQLQPACFRIVKVQNISSTSGDQLSSALIIKSLSHLHSSKGCIEKQKDTFRVGVSIRTHSNWRTASRHKFALTGWTPEGCQKKKLFERAEGLLKILKIFKEVLA